jgi:hypothetical protein
LLSIDTIRRRMVCHRFLLVLELFQPLALWPSSVLTQYAGNVSIGT